MNRATGFAVAIAVLMMAHCSSPDDRSGVGGSGGQTLQDASAEGTVEDGADAPPAFHDAGEPDGGDADASDGDWSPECPRYANGVVKGAIAETKLEELSGLVASRKQARVLWMHNDSGNPPEVFAVRDDGLSLGVFTLSGATVDDWEDVAIGTGPIPGPDYLYVGDIGDNDRERSSVVVYRVMEPAVDADAGPRKAVIDGVERFELVYPDGAHNAETLLVDPASGDVYIVTKADDGRSAVYRTAAPLGTAAANALELVTTLSFGSGALPGSTLATGGDIGVAGSILLRTETSAFVWRRQGGQSVAEALAGTPCEVPIAIEYKGEAIGFTNAEAGYYTAGEDASELYFYARD